MRITLCESNLSVSAGETSCTLCPIGTYGDVTGLSVCKVCDNSISDDIGQTVCVQCEKGTRPNSDNSECERM